MAAAHHRHSSDREGFGGSVVEWIEGDLGDDASTNMLLSIRRVNSVRDALVARGIALARILTVGYGETKPIADNATSEGRRKNRRTEFSWLD